MNPILTVVIPSYDLRPILGPLGLLPELCAAIQEWTVRLSEANVKAKCGFHNTPLMRYVMHFEVAHNPPPRDIKMICDKGRSGLSVWYGAFISPVYGIADHLIDVMRGRNPATIKDLAWVVEDNLAAYIRRASKVMDVECPPEDFNSAFIGLTFDSIIAMAELSRQIKEETDREMAELRNNNKALEDKNIRLRALVETQLRVVKALNTGWVKP